MGREGKLRRHAVNLSLPAGLVDRARACMGNLSATVEDLLAADVAREEAKRRAEDARTRRVVTALGLAGTRRGAEPSDAGLRG